MSMFWLAYEYTRRRRMKVKEMTRNGVIFPNMTEYDSSNSEKWRQMPVSVTVEGVKKWCSEANDDMINEIVYSVILVKKKKKVIVNVSNDKYNEGVNELLVTSIWKWWLFEGVLGEENDLLCLRLEKAEESRYVTVGCSWWWPVNSLPSLPLVEEVLSDYSMKWRLLLLILLIIIKL